MTLGDLIRQYRIEHNMNMQDFADGCGLSKAYISILERNFNPKSGKAPVPTLETIQAVGQMIGIPFNDIIAMLDRNQVIDISSRQDSLPSNVTPMPHLRQVPRLGTIACGTPILAQDNIEGYDQVPDWVKCDFTLTCKGDSMINARIYDGDTVCIKAQPEVENGQIAAVLVEGEFDTEATLKRFYFDGGIVQLVAENPRIPPMVFSGPDVEKVHVLGLATHFVSKIV